MRTNGSQTAFELLLSLKAKELDICIDKIAETADKGQSTCFLKAGGGMICKETVETITESYKFDLVIEIFDKTNTFVTCYFGDGCNGVISIKQSDSKDNNKVDLDDLYNNMEKYYWRVN